MDFLSEYDFIPGEILDLSIIEKNPGNKKEIPYYWYNILLKNTNVIVGQISLRIGNNFHSYYNGNIGFFIEPSYRGNGYAYLATQMLFPLSLAHHQETLFITCNEDNLSSIKIILRLKGTLVDTIVPPKEYIFYYEGMPKQNIYKLNLKSIRKGAIR